MTGNQIVNGYMASFPRRFEVMKDTLPQAAKQVTTLHLVLNEVSCAPSWVSDIENVKVYFPERDLKDVGKFFVDWSDADWVVMFDDDIIYPDDYVCASLKEIDRLAFSRSIYGYHGTTYRRLPSRRHPFQVVRGLLAGYLGAGIFRDTFSFDEILEAPRFVDQIGTGTLFARPEDLPSFLEMNEALCRVDTALARWAFCEGREMVILPRKSGWLKPVETDESIYSGYTARFPKAFREDVRSFAYKRNLRGPIEVGRPV